MNIFSFYPLVLVSLVLGLIGGIVAGHKYNNQMHRYLVVYSTPQLTGNLRVLLPKFSEAEYESTTQYLKAGDTNAQVLILNVIKLDP